MAPLQFSLTTTTVKHLRDGKGPTARWRTYFRFPVGALTQDACQHSLTRPAVFFISFREALETGIIVSVLLAIIKRTINRQDDPALYSAMVRQVWLGTFVGVLVCVLMGIVIIGGVYGLAADQIGGAEDIWEAVFSLSASVVITVMGAVLLRVGKLQDKWALKLSAAMNASGSGREGSGSFVDRCKYYSEKYALFLLPFITVLREGFEGVIFIAGVGIGLPVSSIPLAVLAGLFIGAGVGFLIYK